MFIRNLSKSKFSIKTRITDPYLIKSIAIISSNRAFHSSHSQPAENSVIADDRSKKRKEDNANVPYS